MNQRKVAGATQVGLTKKTCKTNDSQVIHKRPFMPHIIKSKFWPIWVRGGGHFFQNTLISWLLEHEHKLGCTMNFRVQNFRVQKWCFGLEWTGSTLLLPLMQHKKLQQRSRDSPLNMCCQQQPPSFQTSAVFHIPTCSPSARFSQPTLCNPTHHLSS